MNIANFPVSKKVLNDGIINWDRDSLDILRDYALKQNMSVKEALPMFINVLAEDELKELKNISSYLGRILNVERNLQCVDRSKREEMICYISDYDRLENELREIGKLTKSLYVYPNKYFQALIKIRGKNYV